MRTSRAPLGTPLFLLNLKSYPAVLGRHAEKIGLTLCKLSREFGVPAAIAPAPIDVGRLAQRLPIPVLAQHVDPMEAGARTGFQVPDAVRAAGGRGSIVNHSEHPLPRPVVRDVVRMLDRLHLVSVVCAKNARTSSSLAHFHPPYLAVEPPELIGTGRSVSKVKPEVVRDSVLAVRKVSRETHVLCGAGICDKNDVARAVELGSEGVLVASAVALASSPNVTLRELMRGFPRS